MKNIEKIYGIQINIREQIDAEYLTFYKEILERVMRYVNFDIDNYYVYVHYLTITEIKDGSYFGRNLPLVERIRDLTLIYKINPKQRLNMEFINEYGNFKFGEGITHIPQGNQVQFIFNSSHIKEGTLETKLITFLKKDFIREDHLKIKLEIRPHPTPLFEERLIQKEKSSLSPRDKRILKNKRIKENITKVKKAGIEKAFTFTGFDLFFSKQVKFTIPQLLVSLANKNKAFIKNHDSIDDFICNNLSEIEYIMSENWNIHKKKYVSDYELTMIRIRDWLGNFSTYEYDLALKIMGKIKLLSANEIDKMVNTITETIKTIMKNEFEDVYFLGMGESPSDSGSQLLYSIRKSIVLKESKFPNDLSKIRSFNPKALFFFDDIIGTGKQALAFFENNLKKLNVDCYYCVLVGFENGISNLEKKSGFKKIIPSMKLSNENKAFSNNSIHFTNFEERRKMKNFANKYGEKLYPRSPLGFDGSEALIVFPHNVPNNTLPIIWAGASNEKEPNEPWQPLFERRKI